MKRIAILAGCILLLAIAGIFLTSGQGMERETDNHKPVKVGIVMIGSRSENTWNEAHWAGLEKTGQKLKLSLVCEENVSTASCAAVLERMIQDGCRVIVSTSIDFEPAVQKVAQRNPAVYFFQATGIQGHANVAAYTGRMYQMRYLAGIVAGSQTETQAVGYVTTQPIPEVIRGIDAFALGVRKANPQARIYVKYTQDWSDDSKARQVTRELLDAQPDIDVLSMHLDTYGPLEVADERGVYTIGCNVDSRQKYPDTCLTSAIWNWEIFYTKYIREALNGKFDGRNYIVGADTGIVGLAPLASLRKPEAAQLIADMQEKLISGEYDVFYGPIRGTSGNLIVEAGEGVPDQILFEELNWYVEGVVLP